MDKLIQEIEAQIEKLKTVKKLLEETRDFMAGLGKNAAAEAPPKRGRGRPRKHPVSGPAGSDRRSN